MIFLYSPLLDGYPFSLYNGMSIAKAIAEGTIGLNPFSWQNVAKHFFMMSL